MRTDADESAWMSDHSRVSLAELAALSGLTDTMLIELVECGRRIGECERVSAGQQHLYPARHR